MDKRSIIGNVEVGTRWVCMGIQNITGAAGPQILTPPTTGGVTTFNSVGSPKFMTYQANATTWNFSDITTVSPTTGATQLVFPTLPPVTYVGDLSKVQIWSTTAAAQFIVHYYK